ncbi:MAG: RusA family crossover junction endodeoxyribonuclease [Paraclostridium sp.]
MESDLKRALMLLSDINKYEHYIIEIPIRPKPYYRMTQKSKFCDNRAKEYIQYKSDFAFLCKQKIKFYLEKDEHFAIINIAYLKGKLVGDNDNYLKSTKDALNKIAWYDDKYSIIDLALRLPVDDPKEEKTVVAVIKL